MCAKLWESPFPDLTRHFVTRPRSMGRWHFPLCSSSGRFDCRRVRRRYEPNGPNECGTERPKRNHIEPNESNEPNEPNELSGTNSTSRASSTNQTSPSRTEPTNFSLRTNSYDPNSFPNNRSPQIVPRRMRRGSAAATGDAYGANPGKPLTFSTPFGAPPWGRSPVHNFSRIVRPLWRLVGRIVTACSPDKHGHIVLVVLRLSFVLHFLSFHCFHWFVLVVLYSCSFLSSLSHVTNLSPFSPFPCIFDL